MKLVISVLVLAVMMAVNILGMQQGGTKKPAEEQETGEKDSALFPHCVNR